MTANDYIDEKSSVQLMTEILKQRKCEHRSAIWYRETQSDASVLRCADCGLPFIRKLDWAGQEFWQRTTI